MNRSEWEAVRDIDRKLQFISKTCARIEKNEADTAEIKTTLEEMKEVVDDYRILLQYRRKLQKVLLWIITLAVTAAITTVVNFQMNYLMTREETKQPPTKQEVTNTK